MSFLSLSRGDPAARDLLQRAMRARYGIRPLPVESMRLEMVRQDKGALGLPVRIVVTNGFITASHWRRDQVRKLFGLTIGKSSASFDGTTYYRRRGRAVTQSREPRVVQGMVCRLWLEAAFLLTPLTAPQVTVKSIDACTFEAKPESAADNGVTIRLNPDDTVAAVETRCFHPDFEREMNFTVRPSGGLQTLNGFTVPRQITEQWDDEPAETFDVTKAEVNPSLPLAEFSMS
jgi:hypothetical protein